MTSKTDVQNDTPMTLSQHLKELRSRVVVILAAFILTFAVSLYFAKDIIDLLMAMGNDSGYHFVFIAPQELLMVYIQVAVVMAIFVSLPVIVFELYQFAVPALEKNERKAFSIALIFGFLMFLVGVMFAYFISLPFMLFFLINLNVGTEIAASISIQSFISFILTVFVIFGVVFEMPVITSLLTMLGILKPVYLVKARKIAVVLIFFVAALITPPDIVSQTMVAIPMIVLYQISIWLSSSIVKRKKAKETE